MQIQCPATREEIGVDPVIKSLPIENEVLADVLHFGDARSISHAARPLVRRAQLLKAPEFTIAYRTRDDRLAVISHELRNSLGVVRNAARLLVAQQTIAGAIENARLLIERQVGQMSRLIEDLLDGSQLSGPGFLRCERIDLCDLLKQVTRGIQLDIRRRGQRLDVEVPDRPIWLDADPGRLEQVFSNLLINAAKYSHSGGTITLTVGRELEFASVRVRDCGVGITAEVLPRVFGLFVQAEPSARHCESGRGVGLALVRDFVEMHGGRVTAASAGLGQGSEFTVLLPALSV